MGYFDGAQIMVYAFWIFFFSLIIYLRKEDKREGYPLETDKGPREGFPRMPEKKTFLHGTHNVEDSH